MGSALRTTVTPLDRLLKSGPGSHKRVALVIAEYMFIRARERFYSGSVYSAFKTLWKGENLDGHKNLKYNIERALVQHGFRRVRQHQRNGWTVPDQMPSWDLEPKKWEGPIEGADSEGTPEAGPVHTEWKCTVSDCEEAEVRFPNQEKRDEHYRRHHRGKKHPELEARIPGKDDVAIAGTFLSEVQVTTVELVMDEEGLLPSEYGKRLRERHPEIGENAATGPGQRLVQRGILRAEGKTVDRRWFVGELPEHFSVYNMHNGRANPQAAKRMLKARKAWLAKQGKEEMRSRVHEIVAKDPAEAKVQEEPKPESVTLTSTNGHTTVKEGELLRLKNGTFLVLDGELHRLEKA